MSAGQLILLVLLAPPKFVVDLDPNSKAVRGKSGVMKAQLSTTDYDIKKIKVYKDNKVLNIAKVRVNESRQL